MLDAPPPKLLIVEGNDDRHVVEKLLQSHDQEPSFAIDVKGGFSELHKSIYSEVNASKRRTLGILFDANDNPGRRWQSMSDKLKEASCQVPVSISGGGAIFSGPRGVQVGVWMMPDNNRLGELEDFVVNLIPVGDPIWPKAKRYIDEIPAEVRPFPLQKYTRAYVHAWLATRKAPRPMGLAIKAGDLRHDARAAIAFVQWIQRLFGQ